jgi:uncharacterized protein
MTISETEWTMARRVVARARRTSLHCSIASANPDGTPHVTPIGSLVLGDIGTGLYFDIFNRQLASNVAINPRVTILAVDSGRIMWGRSLLKAKFVEPPGIRLVGTISAPRNSRPDEVDRFHRALGPLLRTPGGRDLWGALPRVRDITVERVCALSIGTMT